MQLAAKSSVAAPEFPAPPRSTTERPGPHPDAAHVSEAPTAAAIRRAVGTEPQSRSLASPELEQAVRAFAIGARAMRTPPERMLAALVAIITDNTPADASDWWRSVLRDRIVVWAIEGYYDIDIDG
jgi:hypothetical protein